MDIKEVAKLIFYGAMPDDYGTWEEAQKARPELSKSIVETAHRICQLFGVRIPGTKGYHDVAEFYKDEPEPDKESKLRQLLWATHPCLGKYGDDGELQCGVFLPVIDFKRDKVEDIELKIPLHTVERSLKNKKE